jgi:hypothetical protein
MVELELFLFVPHDFRAPNSDWEKNSRGSHSQEGPIGPTEQKTVILMVWHLFTNFRLTR